jgi:hypothetical protein
MRPRDLDASSSATRAGLSGRDDVLAIVEIDVGSSGVGSPYDLEPQLARPARCDQTSANQSTLSGPSPEMSITALAARAGRARKRGRCRSAGGPGWMPRLCWRTPGRLARVAVHATTTRGVVANSRWRSGAFQEKPIAGSQDVDVAWRCAVVVRVDRSLASIRARLRRPWRRSGAGAVTMGRSAAIARLSLRRRSRPDRVLLASGFRWRDLRLRRMAQMHRNRAITGHPMPRIAHQTGDVRLEKCPAMGVLHRTVRGA